MPPIGSQPIALALLGPLNEPLVPELNQLVQANMIQREPIRPSSESTSSVQSAQLARHPIEAVSISSAYDQPSLRATDDVKAPNGQTKSTSVESVHVDPDQKPAKPLTLLKTSVPPATATRIAWRPGVAFKGIANQAPVLVVHGKYQGPTLCITAAVHGDELNGIELVRRVIHKVKPESLHGTLIGVPIVNIQGFLNNSRYLGDRRDLNRSFPGKARGSLAARIAHSFFNQVILNCSALIDVHTGSFYRDNLPQLRAQLDEPGVVKLTEGFGSTVVIHSAGARGTLRRAAVDYHIPAVTLELGGPMILDEAAVEHGVEGVLNLLDALQMLPKRSLWGTPKPVYSRSTWIRAETGGIFFSRIKLGDTIKTDQILGSVTNPITNDQQFIRSTIDGLVIGLAHNQVVYPGFATVHLAQEAASPVTSETEANQDLSPVADDVD